MMILIIIWRGFMMILMFLMIKTVCENLDKWIENGYRFNDLKNTGKTSTFSSMGRKIHMLLYRWIEKRSRGNLLGFFSVESIYILLNFSGVFVTTYADTDFPIQMFLYRCIAPV
jgi:hypothetical protein